MTTINRQPAGAQRESGSGVEVDPTMRHAGAHDTAGEITDRLSRPTLARITGGLYLASWWPPSWPTPWATSAWAVPRSCWTR